MVDLVLGDTAVGEQLDSVEVAAVIRGEEDSNLTHVGETLSSAKANAGAAADYDCYFAFEFSVHKPMAGLFRHRRRGGEQRNEAFHKRGMS